MLGSPGEKQGSEGLKNRRASPGEGGPAASRGWDEGGKEGSEGLKIGGPHWGGRTGCLPGEGRGLKLMENITTPFGVAIPRDVRGRRRAR